MKLTIRLKGASGSGNFNHEGRPGEVGGSGEGLSGSKRGFTVEHATKRQLHGFALYNSNNEGNDITVTKNKAGKIVAFAQMSGDTIFFLESKVAGAGLALVSQLKKDHDHLIAADTDYKSESYWMKLGFERMKPKGNGMINHDFEWWAD